MSSERGNRDQEVPVTVVMRSYQDADTLPRTLRALDAQEGVKITLGVMESGSTDGSAELFEAHGYAWMDLFRSEDYWSSEVLNRGIARAETEAVVLLNSDAVLCHPHVLRQLVDALLRSPDIAGTFGAQVARPDAGQMTRLEYDQAFGRREELGEQAKWMSLVCSAVRRSVWEKIPFDERITYAEDAVWSEAVREAGLRVEYVASAQAEHSHDYGWAQRYRRAFGDASALAAANQQEPPGWVRGACLPWIRKSMRFGWQAVKKGKPWMAPLCLFYAWPLAVGAWRGARAGWRHFSNADTANEKFDPRLASS